MRALVVVALFSLLSGCLGGEAPQVREHGVEARLAALLPDADDLPPGFVLGYETPATSDMRSRAFDYTLDEGRSWRHSIMVGAKRLPSTEDARAEFEMLSQPAGDDIILSEPDRLVRRQSSADIPLHSERVFVRADNVLLWAFVDSHGDLPVVSAESLADDMVFRLVAQR